MEEMSQRVEDHWSSEDLCSDEEIEEQANADLLHQYIAWLDIYSVGAFLSSRRAVQPLTRSNAGAWVTAEDLKALSDFEEKSMNAQSKKRKG